MKIILPIISAILILVSLSNCTPKANSTKTDTNNTTSYTSIKNEVDHKLSVECFDASKVNLKQACPRNYDPICGCDNKNYTNECEALKAGILQWSKGECTSVDCIDKSKINLTAACPKNYAPVCGCDKKTYDNKCFAEKNGVTKWENGKCKSDCIDSEKVDKKKGCPKIYKPVCGCDGETYSNKCIAEKNGLLKWMPGKCSEDQSSQKEDCIDESKINPNGICPMDYSPVCGCDGNTYSNKCHAIVNGVTRWSPGECK